MKHTFEDQERIVSSNCYWKLVWSYFIGHYSSTLEHSLYYEETSYLNQETEKTRRIGRNSFDATLVAGQTKNTHNKGPP